MEELFDAEIPHSYSSNKRIPRNPKISEYHFPNKFFKPLRVCIGPYNMIMPETNFKKWKLNFARGFISFKPKMFDKMYDTLFGMVGEFKSYYDLDSLSVQVSDEKFTNMMVTDGCFILGFIQYSSPSFKSSIFGYNGNGREKVRSDLFLLENQIPYKVLTELMKFVPDDNWDDKIKHFIDPETFLLQKSNSNTSSANNDDDPIPANTSHLLELLHKRLTKVKHWSVGVDDILTSSSAATELSKKSYWFYKKDSISFRPNSSGSLACIELIESKGASYLLLPPIIMNDAFTHCLLANLICQELYSGGKWICMYVCHLHSLIKHSKDVELLRTVGVLKTGYCTDYEVVDMLNELWTIFIPPAFKREIVISKNDANLRAKSE